MYTRRAIVCFIEHVHALPIKPALTVITSIVALLVGFIGVNICVMCLL